ncbi:hypothetical protein H6G20_02800 [Desertifilum sp. FACHB-1129]|uniref:hypothetical protein n=1 Tax=Desertifilum TaxID=1185872 RepID=UPI00114CE355|nr:MULTISPECIES: hypothetical protein [Desertifilum]MDA0209904.1 hypothetical protein [Cyanobacteria bacterium FC1]MDI9635473.1 hypothetical protein [Geitlerinema splendidum]MBD2310606.1 hypothetical protein [Desertifilum sp. FACHB-1129]MBD2320642.1 hypothetical protein [Desertifilum sp. FACHB-866]MBD2330770.1 hypothetical protein [Desertifilum sp. FACHB-868]
MRTKLCLNVVFTAYVVRIGSVNPRPFQGEVGERPSATVKHFIGKWPLSFIEVLSREEEGGGFKSAECKVLSAEWETSAKYRVP